MTSDAISAERLRSDLTGTEQALLSRREFRSAGQYDHDTTYDHDDTAADHVRRGFDRRTLTVLRSRLGRVDRLGT